MHIIIVIIVIIKVSPCTYIKIQEFTTKIISFDTFLSFFPHQNQTTITQPPTYRISFSTHPFTKKQNTHLLHSSFHQKYTIQMKKKTTQKQLSVYPLQTHPFNKNKDRITSSLKFVFIRTKQTDKHKI